MNEEKCNRLSSELAPERRSNKLSKLSNLDAIVSNNENGKGTIIVTPRTNIEKIVETLQEIADEFDSLDKSDFKNKTQWVIKEILSNKMFKFEENEDTTKEQNMLYQLYSTDFEEQTLLPEAEKEHITAQDEYTIKITESLRQSSSNLQLQPLKLSELGVYFDVFEYASKNGRENLLRQVFYVSFSYKELTSLLTQQNIDRFIEELRIGYSTQPDAFYHNVS